jgi:hypothetical protein
MQERVRSVVEKVWPFRYLVLTIILVIGSFAVMTPNERAIVEPKAVYLLCYASPALVGGAVIGWVAFSRKYWLWGTVGILALTADLVLGSY